MLLDLSFIEKRVLEDSKNPENLTFWGPTWTPNTRIVVNAFAKIHHNPQLQKIHHNPLQGSPIRPTNSNPKPNPKPNPQSPILFESRILNICGQRDVAEKLLVFKLGFVFTDANVKIRTNKKNAVAAPFD